MCTCMHDLEHVKPAISEWPVWPGSPPVCLIIGLTLYLPFSNAARFSEWLSTRPDLRSALETIHANPGAALAPLPIAKQPIILEVGEGA